MVGAMRQVGRAATKGVLGMSAAGTLAFGVLIGPWEGREHVPYYDVGGVLTVCDGITGRDVIPGKYYSDEDCDRLVVREVNKHEAALDRCLHADVPIETKAAFISFTFNVGSGAACRSTLVRKANAGDLVGACNELSRWVFVQGNRVRGLENRRFKGDGSRISERTLCRIGLDKEYRTPLIERVLVKYKNWRSGYEEGVDA